MLGEASGLSLCSTISPLLSQTLTFAAELPRSYIPGSCSEGIPCTRPEFEEEDEPLQRQVPNEVSCGFCAALQRASPV